MPFLRVGMTIFPELCANWKTSARPRASGIDGVIAMRDYRKPVLVRPYIRHRNGRTETVRGHFRSYPNR